MVASFLSDPAPALVIWREEEEEEEDKATSPDKKTPLLRLGVASMYVYVSPIRVHPTNPPTHPPIHLLNP